MLGWNISVHRQVDGRGLLAKVDSPRGTRLAVWQAGLYGLQWIDALVKEGKAVGLGGNGYPYHFTARATDLLARIVEGPPHVNSSWVAGIDSVVLPTWLGKTTIDQPAMNECEPEEWLLVEAWDES